MSAGVRSASNRSPASRSASRRNQAAAAPVVGASELRGFALYLTNGEDPAKIEAAYRFATWLSEPAQQAAWHLATGSIPVRASVATRG